MSNAHSDCYCKVDRDSRCGDCGTMYIMLTNEEIARDNEHRVSLEATRRDLMGLNEELREKIGALERGQDDLSVQLQLTIAHSVCQCELCRMTWQRYKPEGRRTKISDPSVAHFNGS